MDLITEIREWRGVKGLIAAEVLTDDNGTDGYTTGTPFGIAGVAEISRVRDSTSEAHYYNDIPAVVITGESPDTVTINAAKIPLDVYAKITGQAYDNTTGTFIEGTRETKYFAIGYITEDNTGAEVYVWRLKGTFNTPDQTNSTINDGTDANGQELVYTGISTTHNFTATGKAARAVNVEVEKDLVNVANFFDSVQTPDTIVPKTAYKLTKTQGSGTTLNVFRVNGYQNLADQADIYAGETLSIEVTSGTATITNSKNSTVITTTGTAEITVVGNTNVVSAT